jgi:nucleotide-binding universal stress UspA family protein
MIIVSYDGSADAGAAIDHLARLVPGADTTVLTVWEPFQLALTRTGGIGMGVGGAYPDNGEVDRASEEAAQARAAEGAERANAAGLVAKARTAVREDGIATAILAAADELDADAIVVGTRGLTGLRSMLLGSVSHAVLQHADRPVMVVPSPAIAEARREWIHRRHTADSPA